MEAAPPSQVEVAVASPAALLRWRPAPPPRPVWSRSTLLDDLPPTLAPVVLAEEGANRPAPLPLIEIRHLGGVAARPPSVPNAVGGRDGAALVNVVAPPDPAMFNAASEAAASLFSRLRPWSLERTLLNFDPLASAACWDVATRSRLAAIRRRSTPGC